MTYPVGLITADEIVAAGAGKYGTPNTNYYLYRGSSYWYWSLSPFFMSSSGLCDMFAVNTNGNYRYFYVTNTGGSVAPVINLSAEYAKSLKGTGTMADPYQA